MSGDAERTRAGSGFESVLGHRFADPQLLERALSHSSYAHEMPDAESNETLEFLGDRVIGLVVAELLLAGNPSWREGALTRAMSHLVDRTSLARAARELDLGSELRLGRTERTSGGQDKDSILSDAMEAVFGALYLDGGLVPVERLALRLFGDAVQANAQKVGRDPKTRLQERVMRVFGSLPTYTHESDSGMENDDRRFVAAVHIEGELRGRASGRTKRAAERAAAERADEAVFDDAGELLPDAAPHGVMGQDESE